MTTESDDDLLFGSPSSSKTTTTTTNQGASPPLPPQNPMSLNHTPQQQQQTNMNNNGIYVPTPTTTTTSQQQQQQQQEMDVLLGGVPPTKQSQQQQHNNTQQYPSSRSWIPRTSNGSNWGYQVVFTPPTQFELEELERDLAHGNKNNFENPSSSPSGELTTPMNNNSNPTINTFYTSSQSKCALCGEGDRPDDPLFKPCPCDRLWHRATCFRKWRRGFISPRNYWSCPDCLYNYNMERIRLPHKRRNQKEDLVRNRKVVGGYFTGRSWSDGDLGVDFLRCRYVGQEYSGRDESDANFCHLWVSGRESN